MPNQVLALLVGINDYPEGVGTPKLSGCLNDVDHFHDHLKQTVAKDNLAVEVLKDGDATRDNVIRQFRQHLGRARAGDVAVFQYCGHGGQSASASAFREFDLTGLDEGLVCVDSRRPSGGGYDLADKELAVLIDEVARQEAHVAFILDSCHSGSGTRGVDAFGGLRSRLAQAQTTSERALETYLGGHYSRQLKQGERLHIPSPRHILLAACERTQLAQESPADHSGVFTSTLLEVLQNSGDTLTYADLFVRCRAAVRKRAQDQDPQFEPIGQFNPWGGFLGLRGAREGRPYRVYFESKSWKINCGAIQGMPTDPDKSVGVVLFSDKDVGRAAGNARTLEVGTQDSILDMGDLGADRAATYGAAITSLPVAPLLVYCAADSGARTALQGALADNQAISAALTEVSDGARYGLEVEGDLLRLVQRDAGVLIQAAKGDAGKFEASARAILDVVKQVAQWERSVALQNSSSQIDPSLIDFVCSEVVPGAPDFIHPGDEVTLESVRKGKDWSAIDGKLLARNRTGRQLHRVLVYFSEAYGVQVMPSEPFDPGDKHIILFEPSAGFHMEEGTVHESLDRFKLIVSSQPIDGFLLMQDDLTPGATLQTTRAVDGFGAKPTKKVRKDDWLTKNLRVRVVPRLNELSDKNWSSDNGVVVVKGHPKIKANLSMGAAKAGTRGAGEGLPFLDAFARAGLVIPNFSGARGGDNATVLELSDIQNTESLKEQPLEIEIKLALKDNEALLPFVFDGTHVMLGGDAFKDADGTTHVSIDHLHEMSTNRRSLGGSLKLYFFKTYLRRASVNQLRSVEFLPDGNFNYRDGDLAAHVAAAKRVLLLVHGIIGDTEGMAQGVRACGLDSRFDLVLTYDYENLSTPIEETAQALKRQLADAGLHESDDKQLTLLVHSMGGLVSRWFIEREGGNRVVDHLVMCGTPNHGSPFGKVDDARQVLNVLTGLAANYVPTLLPFSAPILFLLNRSKKLTPTLMQMDANSDFIKKLNTSPDPGTPYTIIAGNVNDYQEPTDELFAKLLAKTGQSFLFDALFANQANDIAVSIDSITHVSPTRASAPQTSKVACHHLNYFQSQAGQDALKAAPW